MPKSKRDPNEGLPYERPGEPLYEKEGRQADTFRARHRKARKKKVARLKRA